MLIEYTQLKPMLRNLNSTIISRVILVPSLAMKPGSSRTTSGLNPATNAVEIQLCPHLVFELHQAKQLA